MRRILAPLLDVVRWGEPHAFEDDEDELIAGPVGGGRRDDADEDRAG